MNYNVSIYPSNSPTDRNMTPQSCYWSAHALLSLTPLIHLNDVNRVAKLAGSSCNMPVFAAAYAWLNEFSGHAAKHRLKVDCQSDVHLFFHLLIGSKVGGSRPGMRWGVCWCKKHASFTHLPQMEHRIHPWGLAMWITMCACYCAEGIACK